MYSENGVLVDFEEVSQLVHDADVFVVGFAHFPERLLVDARSDDKEVPLIRVVEPTGSPEQRIRWLKRRRPSLGVPEGFSFLMWPHSIDLLVDSGTWDRIARRLNAATDPEGQARCELALRVLRNLYRDATMAALRGENCLTIWPKPADD